MMFRSILFILSLCFAVSANAAGGNLRGRGCQNGKQWPSAEFLGVTGGANSWLSSANLSGTATGGSASRTIIPVAGSSAIVTPPGVAPPDCAGSTGIMAKVADNINATAQAHIFYWSTFSTPVSTSGTRGYEFDVKRDPSADGLNNLETVLSLGPGTSTTNGATDYLDVFFDLGNCRPINNAANQPVTDTIMKASYIGPTNIAPSFISATGSTIAGGGAGGTLTLTLPTGTGVTTPGQISFTIPALSSTIGAAGLIPVPGSYNPATFAIPAGANQTTGGGYTFTPSGQSCSGTCTGSVTTVTVYMGFSGGQLSNVRQDGRMLKDGWCREHVYFNSAVNNGVQNGTPAVLQWYTTDGVSRSHSGRGTGYLIRNLTGD